MAGVHVDANHVAGCGPEPLEGADVVDELVRVELEREPGNSAALGELDQFQPVRDGDLLPLVLKDVEHVGWPARRDPVLRRWSGLWWRGCRVRGVHRSRTGRGVQDRETQIIRQL